MQELENEISIGDMLLVTYLAYEGITHDKLLIHRVLTASGQQQRQGYWMYRLGSRELESVTSKIKEYNSGKDLVDPRKFDEIKTNIRRELMAGVVED